MKYILRIISLAALVIAAGPGWAQSLDPTAPIDLDLARQYFEEAELLSDLDGGEMWDVRLYGPMLFVDQRTRQVVANTPDPEGRLQEQDGVFVGVLPQEVNIANTTAKWSGVQWAMMIWPLSPHEQERGRLMMHESFHRVQPQLGIELAIRNNHHLDRAEGRIWQRLEWRALAAALEEDDPLAGEAVRDALMFRAWRKKIFRSARTQESPVELNEGLAEYTGLRLSGYNHEARRRRTVGQLRTYERMANFSRSFAYATGPAYGRLLDDADPEWRKKIEPGADLGAILAKAIGVRIPRNVRREARERSAKYDAEALIAEEHAAEEARQERTENLRAEFLKGPVLRIPINGNTNFTFNPHGAIGIEGVGTVYQSMRLTGSWGILDSSRPVLWVTEQEKKHFRIPLPQAPEVDADGAGARGKGWTLQLSGPGWRLRKTSTRGDYAIEPRGR